MRTVMRQPNRAPGAHSVLAYDIETVAPPVPDAGFPPWPCHQPVAIGFAEARESGGTWTFDIAALVAADDTSEADLIRAADARMAAASVITSFNGAQFDALVLRLSAQRNRLWDLDALADHAAAHRYAGEHADLADLYASYGRKVGLAALCEQVGIPVKTDVSGGDVGALWEAGEHERIRTRATSFDAVAHGAGLPFGPMTRTALAEAHRTGCHGAIREHLATRAKATWRLWLNSREDTESLIAATEAWVDTPDAAARL